jgi:hypothetical protein
MNAKDNIQTCRVCGNLYDADRWDRTQSGYECPYCWRNSVMRQGQFDPRGPVPLRTQSDIDCARWKRAALYLAGRLRTHANVVMKGMPDGMTFATWQSVIAGQMHEDIDDGLSQIGQCGKRELMEAHSGTAA